MAQRDTVRRERRETLCLFPCCRTYCYLLKERNLLLYSTPETPRLTPRFPTCTIKRGRLVHACTNPPLGHLLGRPPARPVVLQQHLTAHAARARKKRTVRRHSRTHERVDRRATTHTRTRPAPRRARAAANSPSQGHTHIHARIVAPLIPAVACPRLLAARLSLHSVPPRRPPQHATSSTRSRAARAASWRGQ